MQIGQLPPIIHSICEMLAFFIAFRLYSGLKKRDSLEQKQRMLVLLGGLIGAGIGCKLLSWLEDPAFFVRHLSDFGSIAGGKSLVGALLGGWIGVESAKAVQGVKSCTGDTFVIPLIVGIIVGRCGCFLTSFYDHTYGVATTLPWGMDFGDGVHRHPAQLYEIAGLGILLAALLNRMRKPYNQGDIFKFFMIGYMLFRFFVEFVKDVPHVYFGLDVEQVSAIIVFIYYGKFMASQFKRLNVKEALE